MDKDISPISLSVQFMDKETGKLGTKVMHPTVTQPASDNFD